MGVQRAAGGISILNHLEKEKSPYLLQHVTNPVDWYPWGPEAFEKARKEEKPIFLSIGYSTCHWCHVMERESFTRKETAKILNEHFVSIKVDREERPDVDRVYMTAVQAMTGQGGWPLNAFLTPERKPFFGGTYFPPDSRWGKPGFGDLLTKIAELWREDRQKILDSGEQLAGAITSYAETRAVPGELSKELLDGGVEDLKSAYDPDNGGFGGAPKFAMPVYLNFLARRAKGPDALKILTHSLRAMALGGVCDQLGGGFHRYSTDERWHIPHFEKMLYDNAQLAANYVEAYRLTQDDFFSSVARDTLGYLLRDMSHPGGGFYSAEDADSPSRESGSGEVESKEGAFYTWSQEEILSVVGQTAGEVVCFLYGVQPSGNAQSDPQGEFEGLNILYQARTVEQAAIKFKRTENEITDIMADARAKLFNNRKSRPRPLLDDKILTSWNGLAVSVFSKAFVALGDEKCLEAAAGAARFIENNLWDEKEKIVYRRFRGGERKVRGTSDDYLFLAQGLLDLYEASFDLHWLEWALELTERAAALFFDSKAGGFFMAAEDGERELWTRLKEDSDNVEPSASSIGALNLLRLAAIFERDDLRAMAEKTLKLFAQPMKGGARGQAQMLVALDFYLSPSKQIVIVGEKAAPDTRAMLAEIRKRYQPNQVVLLLDRADQKALGSRLPYIKEMRRAGEKATAYVCENFACREPVNDPAALARLLST